MSKPPPLEKILVGKRVQAKKIRADIFTPGEESGYQLTGKGGVTTRQPKPVAKPKSKPEPTKATPKKAPAAKPEAAPEKAPASEKAPAADNKRKNPPRPGRKPPKKTARRVKPAAEQSQAMAEEMVSSFTGRLMSQAEAKGGHLSVQDLAVLNKEFEQQTVKLKARLEKAFEDHVAQREHEKWSTSRKYPFNRMLVKTFSYMLENDSRKLRRSDSVSRRILPGFFTAISMMLGPDRLESYHGKCRAVVKILQKEYGENFEWDDIYESDDARAIVLDALIDISLHFEDIGRRADWFIELVNNHLPPPDKDTTQTEANWTFTRDGFKVFFNAIMSDLRDALASESGRLLITRRHGVETTIKLVDLVKELKTK